MEVKYKHPFRVGHRVKFRYIPTIQELTNNGLPEGLKDQLNTFVPHFVLDISTDDIKLSIFGNIWWFSHEWLMMITEMTAKQRKELESLVDRL